MPPLAGASCRGCNLLLVTIDTLRADRVGAFGSTRGLTPRLDRLGAEGLRFTRAYTSAPLTLPAHASLLTSASPPVHGVRNNSLFRLGDNLPTLATVLKAAGYRTGAFVGAFVLDARFGLARGFDVYDDRYGEGVAGEEPERPAEEVVARASEWIAQSAITINPQSGLREPQAALSLSKGAIRNPQCHGSPGSTSTIPTLPTARQSHSLRGTSRTTARSLTRTHRLARCSIVCRRRVSWSGR